MLGIIADTLFILFVATPSLVICGSQLARGHRNVVFIVVDDLRPAIGKYGDPIAITPNLDRFLSQSSYFTRAYCQQALCAPSRNSMLTSRRPDTLHLYDFDSYWRTFAGNFTTLPQYFKENGYHTYSTGKVFHPGVSSNFTDDYPVSWSLPAFHPRTEAYMNAPVCPDGSGTLKQNVVCPVNVNFQPERTLPDIESIGEARNFLLQHKSDEQPFFLAVGIHKPHIPFRFPEKYLKLYDRDQFNDTDHMRRYGIPDVAWNPFLDIRKRDDGKKSNIAFPYGPIAKDFAAEIQQAYYASVSYIDNLFGQLLSEIDLSNTIVVFTSDHGWSLGEHGEWAKYSNFDVALRVPLAFFIPGVPPQPIDNIVELVDVFPTLVELATKEVLPSCKQSSIELLCTEGRSLVHLLQGYQSGWPDRALSQYPRPGRRPSIIPNSDEPRLNQIKIMGYSIRTPDFRYTLWVKFYRRTFRKDWNKIFGEELYDHRLDSSENINLADRNELKNVRLHLRSELIKHFR